MIDQAELVRRLREVLDLNEDVATDEEILEVTKGSYLRASIEANMATAELGRAFSEALRPVADRIASALSRFSR